MKEITGTDEGYTCRCGTYHKYTGYVFAHAHIKLNHTCDNCGVEVVVLAFRVFEKPVLKNVKPATIPSVPRMPDANC
jgi:hypothetical protein